MRSPAFRVDVTMTSLTYRGDRDERLTDLHLAGEGDTPEKAFEQVVERLRAFGYNLAATPTEEEPPK